MPHCEQCDQDIDGEVVWYRLGDLDDTDGLRGMRSTFIVSPQEFDDAVPFHPACFTARTGQKWPPEQ